MRRVRSFSEGCVLRLRRGYPVEKKKVGPKSVSPAFENPKSVSLTSHAENPWVIQKRDSKLVSVGVFLSRTLDFRS